MKSTKLITMTMLSLGLVGGIVPTAFTQPAQAATTRSAKRSHSVKLAWRKSMRRHAYHTTSGYRYSAHLYKRYAKMSKNPKTTWYTNAHEKLVVKHNKKARIYYHVISGNKKHAGWIWRGYLKAGVNPAAVKHAAPSQPAKQAQPSNNQPAKQVAPNQPVKQAPAQQNNTQPAKPTPAATPSLPKVTIPTYNRNGQSGSITVTQNPDGTVNDFSAEDGVVVDKNQIRDAFIKAVNRDRSEHNRILVHDDAKLDEVAQTRSHQIVTDFNHNDKQGNAYVVPVAKQAGIYDSYYGTEELACGDFVDTSADKTAQHLLDGYKDNKGDGAFMDTSTHYYDIVNNNSTDKMGVGITYNNNGAMFVCVTLGFKN